MSSYYLLGVDAVTALGSGGSGRGGTSGGMSGGGRGGAGFKPSGGAGGPKPSGLAEKKRDALKKGDKAKSDPVAAAREKLKVAVSRANRLGKSVANKAGSVSSLAQKVKSAAAKSKNKVLAQKAAGVASRATARAASSAVVARRAMNVKVIGSEFIGVTHSASNEARLQAIAAAVNEANTAGNEANNTDTELTSLQKQLEELQKKLEAGPTDTSGGGGTGGGAGGGETGGGAGGGEPPPPPGGGEAPPPGDMPPDGGAPEGVPTVGPEAAPEGGYAPSQMELAQIEAQLPPPEAPAEGEQPAESEQPAEGEQPAEETAVGMYLLGSDVLCHNVVVGEVDIASAQKKLNKIPNTMPKVVANTLVNGGLLTITGAIVDAQKLVPSGGSVAGTTLLFFGFTALGLTFGNPFMGVMAVGLHVSPKILEAAVNGSQLPGGGARKKCLENLERHRQAISALPNGGTYTDGADLKKWVMQANIEANASEEGAGVARQVFDQMWSDVIDNAANLPGNIWGGFKNAVNEATGLPLWAWGLIGGTGVGVVCFGIYRILLATAPVAAAAYLGPVGAARKA